MAKKSMSADQHATILREAREVEQLLTMPGWRIVADAITQQMEQAKNQLAENRLRTIHETVKTNDGEQTFVTTAETQIAETAGMFKMGKWVFDLVDTVLKAPGEVEKLRQQGLIAIAEDKQSNHQRREVRHHDR